MERALELASFGAQSGEIPVGAIVVFEDRIIAEAHNEKETRTNALLHAEMLALERASAALGRWRLKGCTLFVTLEPCVMCAGAVVQTRVDRIVFGCTDPKAGGVVSLYQILGDLRLNHRPEIKGDVRADECRQILREFFIARRQPASRAAEASLRTFAPKDDLQIKP